jgi:hypothetical protein
LQLTPIIQKPILNNYSLEFSYDLMNEVMMVVKRYNCAVLQNEMQLFCHLKIGVPVAEEQNFLDRIKDMHSVEVRKEG